METKELDMRKFIDSIIEDVKNSGGSAKRAFKDIKPPFPFFLLVPCSHQDAGKIPFKISPASPYIVFKTINNQNKASNSYTNPDEVRPFDAPAGYSSYYDFIDKNQNSNRSDLVETYRLYNGYNADGTPSKRRGYIDCYKRHKDDMFMLSSLWGIMGAKKKIPFYDVELKINKRSYGRDYHYIDNSGKDLDPAWLSAAAKQFNDLETAAQKDPEKPIIFIGIGKYIERFLELGKNIKNKVYVIYNKNYLLEPYINIPANWIPINANLSQHSSWHYEFIKII